MTARRAARLLAAAAMATLAVLAAAGPASAQSAQAGHGQVTITIESVSPQWAAPGKTVTVTGIVTNATPASVQGLYVQLRSSASELGNRDELSLYAQGEYPADEPVGTAVPVAGSVAAGATAAWKATLVPSDLGITGFGVYPLAAQLINVAGSPLSTDRTFLPFWPGGPASTSPQKLSIAWVWPLIDQPAQVACPALVSTQLASSLAHGGRLDRLLAAGQEYSATADLTWAIDPALVQNAQVMSSRYLAGGTANCGSAQHRPASKAASSWLTALSGVIAGQPVFLTPYGNVDVAALSHEGLDNDLDRAFTESQTAAQAMHLPASAHTTAWPVNGQADAGVLGSLAVNKIGTVLLNSSVMPPAGVTPNYTPSAQTTIASGVGSSLNVLLTDDTISQLLSADNSASNTAGAAFATAQSFLAQTAMIVAEAPALARSVVIAPPQQWNPPAGLASDLLGETVTAPWLKPSSLAGLAAVKHPSGQVARQAPPAHQVSGSELSPGYLSQVARVDAAVQLQASLLSPPDPSYLSHAVAALESVALRGKDQASTRQVLVSRVLGYLAGQNKKVSIIDSGEEITLGGSSGKVPVTIVNRLSHTVRVKLTAQVPADGRLTIDHFSDVVTIAPGKTTTVRLQVRAATVGATNLMLSLHTTKGRLLPGSTARLSLHATRFGTLALIIMSGALGIFVLTSSARAIRRSRKDHTENDNQGSDPPGAAAATGSVGSGNDLAHDHQPPEDPDEYADARGRASS